MRKWQWLVVVGGFASLIGYGTATDAGASRLSFLVFHLGSIALTAGLAAWAVLHDAKNSPSG